MNKGAIFVMVIVLLLAMVFGILNRGTTGQTTMEKKGTIILLETTKGNIEIELYKDMEITSGNFEKLVKEGFYNNILFHRVIDGFMIQGGDPLTKDPAKKALWGTGGSEVIKDEFKDHSNIRGTIAMANAGPNTGSSQFFINLVNNNFLDTKHPVFGEVIKGMEIVDAIAKVETDSSDRPIEEVRIIKASVIE